MQIASQVSMIQTWYKVDMHMVSTDFEYNGWQYICMFVATSMRRDCVAATYGEKLQESCSKKWAVSLQGHTNVHDGKNRQTYVLKGSQKSTTSYSFRDSSCCSHTRQLASSDALCMSFVPSRAPLRMENFWQLHNRASTRPLFHYSWETDTIMRGNPVDR